MQRLATYSATLFWQLAADGVSVIQIPQLLKKMSHVDHVSRLSKSGLIEGWLNLVPLINK